MAAPSKTRSPSKYSTAPSHQPHVVGSSRWLAKFGNGEQWVFHVSTKPTTPWGVWGVVALATWVRERVRDIPSRRARHLLPSVCHRFAIALLHLCYQRRCVCHAVLGTHRSRGRPNRRQLRPTILARPGWLSFACAPLDETVGTPWGTKPSPRRNAWGWQSSQKPAAAGSMPANFGLSSRRSSIFPQLHIAAAFQQIVNGFNE